MGDRQAEEWGEAAQADFSPKGAEVQRKEFCGASLAGFCARAEADLTGAERMAHVIARRIAKQLFMLSPWHLAQIVCAGRAISARSNLESQEGMSNRLRVKKNSEVLRSLLTTRQSPSSGVLTRRRG